MPNRTFAVGDIHGCVLQLDVLLDQIAPTADDQIVFLGDLIDRGPDAAGVLDRVIKFQRTYRVKTVKGNHEQMLLDARDSHAKYTDWIQNGGDATLRSYAGVRSTLKDIRPEHWQFLEQQLVDYVETDTHILVHANVYPDQSMEDQPDYMLRWERCDQITAHESGKTIVCGHTPQKSGRPMNRGYAICIDTDVCSSEGNLTCLETNSGYLWQADKQGRLQKSHLSDYGNDERII